MPNVEFTLKEKRITLRFQVELSDFIFNELIGMVNPELINFKEISLNQSNIKFDVVEKQN